MTETHGYDQVVTEARAKISAQLDFIRGARRLPPVVPDDERTVWKSAYDHELTRLHVALLVKTADELCGAMPSFREFSRALAQVTGGETGEREAVVLLANSDDARRTVQAHALGEAGYNELLVCVSWALHHQITQTTGGDRE